MEQKYNLYESFYLDGNDNKIFCSEYAGEINYIITKANSEYIDSNKALYSSDYWNLFSSKSVEEKLCQT